MQNKTYYLNRNRYIKKQSGFKTWQNKQTRINIVVYGGMIGIWIYVLCWGIVYG